MATKEISIRVSDQAAEAYRAASPDERRKLDALLSMRLTETVRSQRSLEEVMSEMSRRAQERGLMPEKPKRSSMTTREPRYVFDTNTLISAALFEGFTPARAFR